jgi:hypothetical protein
VTLAADIQADETDGGRPRAARERTCAVTRVSAPASELMRFVVAPDGAVTPDLKAALPGRGVWLTPTAEAVARAVRGKVFARAFRREVVVPPDLGARVEALLAVRAREALALANKAGAVIVGFAQVEAALGRRPLALLHAQEAAEDGAEKLDRKYRALVPSGGEVLRPFAGVELDLALGRSNVVHAALDRASAARACLDRIRTLVRFRGEGRAVAKASEGRAPSSGTDRV